MEVQLGVAKISKVAARDSGDTFEVVERPHGGLSFVLADGQRGGKGSKAISNIVARKAMTLLAEGVRDGVAARAAHDYLYTQYNGQVESTLNLVSLDLVTRTIVISRNNPAPVYVAAPSGLRPLDEPSEPIGTHRGTKPIIAELPFEPHMFVVVYSDGVDDAGVRHGQRLDLPRLITDYTREATNGRPAQSAQGLADLILATAVQLDQGRAEDDMSVAVVAVAPRTTTDGARRLNIVFPLDP